MNSLKGLSFQLITAGRQLGEEVVFKGRDWLQKFFVHQDRLQGFVLLGQVEQAGVYMNLLQTQRPLGEIRRHPGGSSYMSSMV
jgi:NAD(P)H-nitrite reductase large subunit